MDRVVDGYVLIRVRAITGIFSSRLNLSCGLSADNQNATKKSLDFEVCGLIRRS
jgi:hypothetical protein